MTEREYNDCVDAHADGVYRFILKSLGHVEDSRDIVQSAFEKMWKNRSAVINKTAKSYLFTVAYHQMIDHLRKNKKIHVIHCWLAKLHGNKNKIKMLMIY